jgi:hypothetical protein
MDVASKSHQMQVDINIPINNLSHEARQQVAVTVGVIFF